MEMENDPDLPPMEPGLPNTPAVNCKELLLQVLIRGLLDDDYVFVSSRFFLILCMYLGLDPETAVKVKLMFYRGQLNRSRLESVLMGAYIRRPEDGDGASVFWQSWKVIPV